MQASAIAQSGLVQAIARFDASAQRTARAGDATGEVDLAAEAVEQVSASHHVKANLAVLETANDLQKRLLDIRV